VAIFPPDEGLRKHRADPHAPRRPLDSTKKRDVAGQRLTAS
jgi:hypothetical protein